MMKQDYFMLVLHEQKKIYHIIRPKEYDKSFPMEDYE